jgi:hypothetical protein
MSATEARSICREIFALEKELKNLDERKNKLRELKKTRFNSLYQWIEASGESTFTCDGRTFRLVNKPKVVNRVRDSDKREILSKLVKNRGDRNSEKIWDEFKAQTKPERMDVKTVELVKEGKGKKK